MEDKDIYKQWAERQTLKSLREKFWKERLKKPDYDCLPYFVADLPDIYTWSVSGKLLDTGMSLEDYQYAIGKVVTIAIA